MGPYEVGEPVEIPGFRENLYRWLTVNLGVFVQEVHDHFSEVRRPKFVSEPCCEVRRRLGELTPAARDVWWNLDHDPHPLAADVRGALERHGLPFLDRFRSRSAILEAWYRDGDAIGLPPRGKLSMALIHWHRGEHETAERLIADYLAGDLQPSHLEFVKNVVRRLGSDEPFG